jgi:acyl-CoA thioester hydrolase
MKFHETEITVRFNEVDSYQVAWHGHYVAWMEYGRNEFAGKFGIDAQQLVEMGWYGPVVSLEMKYLRPARFKDRLTVRTTLRPTVAATLIFVTEIVDSQGVKLADGVTTHVLTDAVGVMQFRLPVEIAERVELIKSWVLAP